MIMMMKHMQIVLAPWEIRSRECRFFNKFALFLHCISHCCVTASTFPFTSRLENKQLQFWMMKKKKVKLSVCKSSSSNFRGFPEQTLV